MALTASWAERSRAGRVGARFMYAMSVPGARSPCRADAGYRQCLATKPSSAAGVAAPWTATVTASVTSRG